MDYSIKEWDGFYEDNEVLVPYLDVCVFAAKRLKKCPDATLYEFGCGNGNNLKFLKSLFPAARVLGSDISVVAIDKLRAAAIPSAAFWTNGDRLSIPEPIDLAIERGALQHVSKVKARAYLDEIFEAMRPRAEGFFEIASLEHSLSRTVGDGGHDPAIGLRTFYSEADIRTLFSRFTITRLWHLKREVIGSDQAQGSWQVEVQKLT